MCRDYSETRENNKEVIQVFPTITMPSGSYTLSPTSTQYSKASETFTPEVNYTPSETDRESTDTSSEYEVDEDESEEANKDRVIRELDARLLTVLNNHLDLAASLLPRISYLTHAALNKDVNRGISTAATEEAHENTQGQGSSEGSSAANDTAETGRVPNSEKTRQKKRRQKGKESEEEEEGSIKRPKLAQLLPNEAKHTFACHYHKRYPEKYDSRTSREYRCCPAPSIPVQGLRRIK